MNLKFNFFNIFKSLNPYNYLELSNMRISIALRYFFFLVMFCVTIIFVLSVPYIYKTSEYVSAGVGYFDTLSLTQNFQVKDSFNILADPLIMVGTNNSNSSDEMILITPQNIFYKKFLFFGKQRSMDLSNDLDLINSSTARRLVVIGIFFLLPAILFWVTTFWILYFLAIILLTFILVLMAAGSLRIDASAVHLFKMTVYSSTLLILSQILLLPFYATMLLPILIYWLFIMAVMFLWYDNPPGRGGVRAGNNGPDNSNPSPNNVFGDSKNKSIFGGTGKSGSSGSSGFGSSRKTPQQDSYDVDENGNMRGNKRRKSFNEENDGYVEL